MSEEESGNLGGSPKQIKREYSLMHSIFKELENSEVSLKIMSLFAITLCQRRGQVLQGSQWRAQSAWFSGKQAQLCFLARTPVWDDRRQNFGAD